jgi:excinuclease ABC subunit B
VIKSTEQVRFITRVADAREATEARQEEQARRVSQAAHAKDPTELIAQLEKEMKQAAADLDFETAARLRDQLFEIRAKFDGNRSRSRASLAAIRVER